ncbi:MAG: twin-arginine translocation pathway signal protein [Casimicrobium sp.]
MVLGLGGALVASAGGLTWRVTRMPQAALAPWQGLDEPVDDVRLDAFRHAILAPNPHNRQPWVITLEGADSALLRCDLAKRLPETDPFDRQITIGFGTFIELAAIAASRRGVRLDVEPFPEGLPRERLDGRALARLRFVADPAVKPDPLFAAISQRRTNRQVYDPPGQATLGALAAEGLTTSADPQILTPLRQLVVAAITQEMHTPAAHLESVRLMRIGQAEVDARPDGLALTGPLIEATSLLGLTTRASLADPASTAFRLGLEDLQKVYGSIPAAGWIITPGNSRAEQLAAGRRYARATLRGTLQGLAMHPISQAVQEYPQVAPHFAAVHRLLGVGAGARIQMLVRVGRAGTVPAAPRYPLEAHLRP